MIRFDGNQRSLRRPFSLPVPAKGDLLSKSRFTRTAWRAAQDIHGYADTLFSKLARWLTTDHSGMTNIILDLPYLSWREKLSLLIQRLLMGIFAAFLTGFLYFLLIAFGIPLLISFLLMG